MGRMEEQQWTITLGNTLLASIVCLLWYVFGLWEDKDKVGEESGTLTSAIEKKKVTRVDKEEVACTNGSTPGHLSSRPEEKEEEQRLYMLPEQGRQLIIDQIKLRQEESAMQLKEEKTSINEEPKKKKTTSDVRHQTMTVFQWPQNAAVLESALPNTSNGLSSDLEDKLKDLGIFRAGGDDDGSQVEGAARRCGLELTKKQVRVSFDTFMAKSRPGLESDEEVKESSPKPKKRQNNNNNNNNNEDNKTKEHGEQQGADPNGGVEQPSLEDCATSTQSSSCEGVLVTCLPLNMSKNIISALYVIYNVINYL